MIMLGFQNTKTSFLKDTFKIGQKKFLLLVKLKTVLWTYVISNLSDQPITGIFMKKNCKKLVQKIRIEKVLKRKGDKLYVKWKGYDNSFNCWIDTKDLI